MSSSSPCRVWMGAGREQVSQERVLCNSINPNRCTGQVRGLDSFGGRKKECTQLEFDAEKDWIANKELCQRLFIVLSSVRFLRAVMGLQSSGTSDLNMGGRERLDQSVKAKYNKGWLQHFSAFRPISQIYFPHIIFGMPSWDLWRYLNAMWHWCYWSPWGTLRMARFQKLLQTKWAVPWKQNSVSLYFTWSFHRSPSGSITRQSIWSLARKMGMVNLSSDLHLAHRVLWDNTCFLTKMHGALLEVKRK